MWAQLITMRLKPGKDADLPRVYEQLRAIEQPGTGLVRTMAMRDQKDPSRVFNFVIFESEEKARAREQDPRRQEGLQAVRATMAEIFDGPPEIHRPDSGGGHVLLSGIAPVRPDRLTDCSISAGSSAGLAVAPPRRRSDGMSRLALCQ